MQCWCFLLVERFHSGRVMEWWWAPPRGLSRRQVLFACRVRVQSEGTHGPSLYGLWSVSISKGHSSLGFPLCTQLTITVIAPAATMVCFQRCCHHWKVWSQWGNNAAISNPLIESLFSAHLTLKASSVLSEGLSTWASYLKFCWDSKFSQQPLQWDCED
jgi:hypothetical protein